MNEDIRPIIKNWTFKLNTVSVRKIVGCDGREKVQMRIDLGLLQMELVGRPDGQKPEGFESLLDYYQNKLEEYRKIYNTDIGFELSAEDCRRLREEAVMYYHRYLACFVIEEYRLVIADTEHNLQIFDLCGRYAGRKSDRLMLEQYRPYLIMMNTRAKAMLARKSKKYSLALKHIKTGLKEIKKLYEDSDLIEDFSYAPETEILKQLARRIRRKLPANPLKILHRKLKFALHHQRYEEAAVLNEEIKKIKRQKSLRKKKNKKKSEK